MLDTRLGDLYRFNQEYLLHNQVPDASEVQESMSLCILVRIQKPDGSKEQYVWLPEYKFVQMFERLIPPKKKENKS